MSLEKRKPSGTVYDLVDEILFKIDNPNDVIDLAILLTLLSYGVMKKLENMSAEEFIAEWSLVIRKNIEDLDGD